MLASEARPMIAIYSRFCNICVYIYIYIYIYNYVSLSLRTLCKDERTLCKLFAALVVQRGTTAFHC